MSRRNIRVFRGENREVDMKPLSQSRLITDVMRNQLDLNTTHTTHATRPLIANRLKEQGVHYRAIANGGRWELPDVMGNTYLRPIEPDVILEAAGYCHRKREYHIDRARAVPSRKLILLLFPWLEVYEEVVFKDVVFQHMATLSTYKMFLWMAEV
jgi:hypothetical protein